MRAFPTVMFALLSAAALLCFLSFPAAHGVEEADALELSPESFQTIVKDPAKSVFVMFYAPWCGHCVRLKPNWAALAKEMEKKPDVVVAKIDASQHRAIADAYGIRGFPTLKFFPKGNKEGLPYNGPRDVASLANFINANI